MILNKKNIDNQCYNIINSNILLQEKLSENDIVLLNPSNNSLLGYLSKDTDIEINNKILRAKQSFKDKRWVIKSLNERKIILKKLSELITKNAIELAVIESLMTGKPIKNSFQDDVFETARYIEWMSESIDKITSNTYMTDRNISAHSKLSPIGVVLSIIPWNFPLLIAAWKMIPPLVAGNSVILKPSEHSPLTALKLQALSIEAGVPEGVVEVIIGDAESLEGKLLQSSDIDCITATCSTDTGLKILSSSSETNIKRVWLECGGKNPNIIYPDVDNLEKIIKETVLSVTYNSGQVCTSPSRLIVHSSIKYKVLELLHKEINKITAADPFDLSSEFGPISNKVNYNKIVRLTGETLSKGISRISTEDPYYMNSNGLYFPPTVLYGIDHTMKESQCEIFGPVITLEIFNKDEDLFNSLENNQYGLSASIWSNDIKTISKVTKNLNLGFIKINTFQGGGYSVPFGGLKNSGVGIDHSLDSIKQFCNVKSIINGS